MGEMGWWRWVVGLLGVVVCALGVALMLIPVLIAAAGAWVVCAIERPRHSPDTYWDIVTGVWERGVQSLL